MRPGPHAVPVPGHPGFWCTELDESLAKSLIERTLDPEDVRLREMTRDLARFASSGRLEQWRPGRDLLCLVDDAGSLHGFGWLAEKPLPKRDDYFDPEQLRREDPRLTCAIRTYGETRGRGLLTKAFAECALDILLRRRTHGPIWFETKARNAMARALGRQLGFAEVSGEEGGTVIGLRPG